MDFRDSGQGGAGDVATVMDDLIEKTVEQAKVAEAKAQPLSSSAEDGCSSGKEQPGLLYAAMSE